MTLRAAFTAVVIASSGVGNVPPTVYEAVSVTDPQWISRVNCAFHSPSASFCGCGSMLIPWYSFLAPSIDGMRWSWLVGQKNGSP